MQGHYVHIKQSPIKGNLHITKEHKSLGGLKTDFNFEVKQKVQLSITTFTSLENQTNSLRDTKEPRIRQVEGESFFNRSSVSHLKHITLKSNSKKQRFISEGEIRRALCFSNGTRLGGAGPSECG